MAVVAVALVQKLKSIVQNVPAGAGVLRVLATVMCLANSRRNLNLALRAITKTAHPRARRANARIAVEQERGKSVLIYLDSREFSLGCYFAHKDAVNERFCGC